MLSEKKSYVRITVKCIEIQCIDFASIFSYIEIYYCIIVMRIPNENNGNYKQQQMDVLWQ